ncbi:ABC transporter ATP-binding protein [Marinoscillum luteum]|uniref:ABC transporter ATP-binding protein n=1 Tax=Marinoscillum luteum TaxID=861051 RepID=A0ABW7NA41_9BACT
MTHEAVISVQNLMKTFGSFHAVNDISFDVYRGEIFGFLGANGAGKTTAMKMLTGLWKPTSGKATVAGCDVFTQAESVKRSIGYMSQRFSLYADLTVKENIELFGGIYGLSTRHIREKRIELLSRLALTDSEHELISALPLGWKQKLAFSVAMLHDPQIVFLDEPTGGVDPITRRQFWDLIYEAADLGKTIFVTTHYMDEAEYCDRISMMVDGKITALGTPDDLKKQFLAKDMDEVFIKVARHTQPIGQ